MISDSHLSPLRSSWLLTSIQSIQLLCLVLQHPEKKVCRLSKLWRERRWGYLTKRLTFWRWGKFTWLLPTCFAPNLIHSELAVPKQGKIHSFSLLYRTKNCEKPWRSTANGQHTLSFTWEENFLEVATLFWSCREKTSSSQPLMLTFQTKGRFDCRSSACRTWWEGTLKLNMLLWGEMQVVIMDALTRQEPEMQITQDSIVYVLVAHVHTQWKQRCIASAKHSSLHKWQFGALPKYLFTVIKCSQQNRVKRCWPLSWRQWTRTERTKSETILG